MVQKLQGVDVKCIPDLEFSIEVGAKSEEGLYKNQWVFQVNCEELMEVCCMAAFPLKYSNPYNFVIIVTTNDSILKRYI